MKTTATKIEKTEALAPAANVGHAEGKPSQAAVDRDILHACLARIARMLGYADEHMPAHTGDIDVSAASEKIQGIAQWAKTAKLS
jgi:hypothetical protein